MKVTLPVITKDKIVEDKRVVEYGNKEFEFDISLASQMRWEAKFAEQAKSEELIGYIDRIAKVEKNSMASIIAKMKGIYCFFDTDISFSEFLKMFDFSNAEYIKKLTNKLNEIFNLVFETASEKN